MQFSTNITSASRFQVLFVITSLCNSCEIYLILVLHSHVPNCHYFYFSLCMEIKVTCCLWGSHNPNGLLINYLYTSEAITMGTIESVLEELLFALLSVSNNLGANQDGIFLFTHSALGHMTHISSLSWTPLVLKLKQFGITRTIISIA